ncbi:hypothetical protein F4680DRAFT_238718 [Xylaria scruposa]|nr:hypothetical protein F4680DRAFT_238718 [Xylaria scruposa]
MHAISETKYSQAVHAIEFTLRCHWTGLLVARVRFTQIRLRHCANSRLLANLLACKPLFELPTPIRLILAIRRNELLTAALVDAGDHHRNAGLFTWHQTADNQLKEVADGFAAVVEIPRIADYIMQNVSNWDAATLPCQVPIWVSTRKISNLPDGTPFLDDDPLYPKLPSQVPFPDNYRFTEPARPSPNGHLGSCLCNVNRSNA